jgi:ethanolamine utilization protein EutQ (cupin superfamily)
MAGQGENGPRGTIRVFQAKHVAAAGNKPKQIAEHVGRVASGDAALSVAVMRSPTGWVEPAQTPEFDEYTVVLRGELHVLSGGATTVVRAGEAVHVPRGIRVQYATPGPEGAEYVAICLPAFSPDLVHRDPA